MNPTFDDLLARMRRQKLLSLALVLFTLAVGIVIGTVITHGVVARDRAVAPGATPLTIPAPAQLSSAFAQIAKTVRPSVVNINTQSTLKQPRAQKRRSPREREDPFEDFFDRFFEFGPFNMPEDLRQRSLGSGIVVDRNGYILTNRHVIERADRIQVKLLSEATQFDAKVIGSDPETDLAVIKIEAKNALVPAKLGNSDGTNVGDWVLAIGSPFGLEETVTAGIISAKGRDLPNTGQFQHFLQTDAAINPGSSGGPLVDMKGEVIGLNTAIASHNGSNSGVAFSIPINLVKRVTKQLLEQGAVARGYLGMQLAQAFEPNDALKLGLDRVRGGWIERVYPNTPAADAGLRVHDVILQVENIAIKSDTHLINLISNLPAGQRIRMQVWRDRTVVALEAVVGDWARAQNRFRAEQ